METAGFSDLGLRMLLGAGYYGGREVGQMNGNFHLHLDKDILRSFLY
jgi:hypothetical protein